VGGSQRRDTHCGILGICTLWAGITTEIEARVLVRSMGCSAYLEVRSGVVGNFFGKEMRTAALTGADQLRAAVSSSCWYEYLAFVLG
jgi:hypothetical protein